MSDHLGNLASCPDTAQESGQVPSLSQLWLAHLPSVDVTFCPGIYEALMRRVDYLVGRSGSCVCNPGPWSPLRVQCLPAPQTYTPQWAALPECRVKTRKKSGQVQICATLPRVRSGWWMPRTLGWRMRKRKTRRKRRPSFLRRHAFSCAWGCCCLWLVGEKVADTGC